MDYEYRFFAHSISAHGVGRLDKISPLDPGWEPAARSLDRAGALNKISSRLDGLDSLVAHEGVRNSV